MDTLYFEFHRSNMGKQIRSKPLFPHSLPHSSCCLSIPEGTLPELPSGMVVVVGPHLCSAPLYEHRAAQTGPICPALLQSHCSHCSTQGPPSCCLPALHCKDHIQGLSDPPGAGIRRLRRRRSSKREGRRACHTHLSNICNGLLLLISLLTYTATL